MRPISITVEGLRSFRSRVHIDFGARQLLAIVGDTGVGKSSILEAITYALYAGTTWTAHNNTLISDTATDMLVELTFACDGKTYTVTRSNSRANRPATAQLHCHDDGHTLDNVRAVNSEIENLLGLDRDTFLKTVILPQGKFAALLMSTPADRNLVLRNIFRVDALDAVRDLTKEIRDRVAPHIEGVKQRLAALPDDPAAALTEANARQAEAATKLKELISARKAARVCENKRNDADSAGQQISGVISELADIDLSEVETEMVEISKQHELLTQRQTRQEQAQKTASELIVTLSARIKTAIGDGLDERVLTRAQTTLETLVELVPNIRQDIEELRIEGTSITENEKQTSDLASDANQKKSEHASVKKAANEWAAKARGAADQLANAEAALTQAVDKHAAHEDAAAQVSEVEARINAAKEQLAAAEKKATIADDELTEANAVHTKLERAHAASHAAEDAEPGAPCPVCGRPLPDDFTRPTAPSLTKARARKEAADRASRSSAEHVAGVREVIKGAAVQLQVAKQSATRARTANASATKRVLALLGTKTVDLSKPAAQLLASLRTTQEKAHRQEEALQNAMDDAHDAAIKAATREAEHRELISGQERLLTQNRARCERLVRSLNKDLEGLPALLRPVLGDLQSLDAVEPKSLVVQPLTKVLTEIQSKLGRLTKLEEEISQARRTLDGSRDELSTIAKQTDEQVIKPLRAIGALVQQSASDLNALSSSSGFTMPKIRLAANDLEGSVFAVNAQRNMLKSRADEELVKQTDHERKAAAQLRDVLRAHDARDLGELDEYVDRVAGNKQDASRDVEHASKALATSQELSKKLGVGGQLVDDLDQLREILGKFIAAVLSERAQSLLAVASRRLDQVTCGRFAFTKDFEVLDQLTGQPRRAETLSGGESFLASLSLALGMVDLAARAGGRLDALFLDEGFGALDNTNLSAAIDALEATSTEGRMVAVISHIKAVADRIEDVMVVLSTPDGSDAVWLDDAERSGLRHQELTAAMSGLLD